ncbi:MAG: U32 family peptidase [Clostridia bacterium]|nr:U32 family peptidase [Clostridia bacterium]
MKPELLAPAGTFEKMKTAFRFGADAVYFAGKKFGLRAFAGNFDEEEIETAVKYAHGLNKKVYITINILAHEDDFDGLPEYIKYLEKAGVDAVIVADFGIVNVIKETCPNLEVHISTQANVLNSYAINFLAKLGVKRIILARELSIEEIKKIRKKIPKEIDLECFVHGAMCISYSGRCLLSNYLSGRDSNRGACVQACRWKYCISEISRKDGQKYEIQEDARGTYILNSKDMCMIEHLKELEEAGVNSFKIEGRMKSEYYVATVVNAYRKAIDQTEDVKVLRAELEKASHRHYTTGFYFAGEEKECLETSMPIQTHEFVAVVLEDADGGKVKIQQRNRFLKGDTLEVLSPNQETFNKEIVVEDLKNINNEEVTDAKQVQQTLFLKTDLKLQSGDILRKKV